ncbi:MAG: hypothetical protein AAF585_08930 [Verrucomicrobiota bacterium]
MSEQPFDFQKWRKSYPAAADLNAFGWRSADPEEWGSLEDLTQVYESHSESLAAAALRKAFIRDAIRRNQEEENSQEAENFTYAMV